MPVHLCMRNPHSLLVGAASKGLQHKRSIAALGQHPMPAFPPGCPCFAVAVVCAPCQPAGTPEMSTRGKIIEAAFSEKLFIRNI